MPKFKSKIWFFKILFKNNNLKNYEDSKIAPFLSCLSVVIFNYMKVKNISRTRCCHLIRNIGNLTECHAIYLFELYIIKKATRPITIYLAFWILSRIFFYLNYAKNSYGEWGPDLLEHSGCEYFRRQIPWCADRLVESLIFLSSVS